MRRRNLTPSPLGAIFSLASTYVYHLWSPGIYSWTYVGIGLLAILHMAILYLLASRFSQSIFGEFMRGAMIGLNSGWNGLTIYYFTSNIYISASFCFILTLSSFLSISRNKTYHILISWLNWLLPMSLAVNLPGLIIFLINLLIAPLGYLHPLLHGIRLRYHWDSKCLSITLYGGLIRPIRGFAGLNMGNFIFINPGWGHLLKHEKGHLLSLAAMGSIFHYIGGIDENYLQKYYWKALAEYFAESYSEGQDSVLSIWG